MVTKEEVIENIKKNAYGFGGVTPNNEKFRKDLEAIGFDLRYAKLENALFSGAELWGVDFHGADLRDADCTGTNMHDAILTSVNAQRASFHLANLAGAKLMDADLRNAELSNACLMGADIKNVKIKEDHAIVLAVAARVVDVRWDWGMPKEEIKKRLVKEGVILEAATVPTPKQAEAPKKPVKVK